MNLPTAIAATLVAALAAMLPCNGAAQGNERGPGDFDHSKVEGYKPGAQALGRLSAEAALDVVGGIAGLRPRNAALREAIGGFRYNLFIDRREISSFRPVADVRKVELYEDRLEFQLSRQDRGPSTYYFHDLPAEMEIIRDGMVVWMYGVTISKDWVLWCSDGGLLEENRAACAKELADALFVLRKAGESLATDDEKFKAVAAQYRALGARPQIPEEIRRYKVQAEFMIGQRRYVDAIPLYSEALKAAPWWPEGRFNRALLLAESKRYRDAIQEMNRYLMLEPEAADSRTAQDRVYQWEAAMKLGVK
ncbi:MAG: tetratricopeptide repeat protein [Betaproteobacteria bacterium]|nr:tetratricopeptide repeat protein [Betaproteobacteria bacterium]